MTLTTAYAALGAGAAVWAVLVSRLMGKPWLTKDAVGALREGGPTDLPPAKIGLVIFLGVVTSLFALFMTAYHMRMMDGMERGDWQHLPVPPLLWANTAALMLGSGAMQWARAAAERGEREPLRLRLALGGLLTGAFLAGQLLAWRQIGGSAYFAASNPAVAFFYVLTAVHGLHLLGGLVVWASTVRRLSRPEVKPLDLRLTVGLCTVYWHFLLLVWLVLFGLLLST
jgi:cytochrome c oxidase subunit III